MTTVTVAPKFQVVIPNCVVRVASGDNDRAFEVRGTQLQGSVTGQGRLTRGQRSLYGMATPSPARRARGERRIASSSNPAAAAAA